MKLACRSELRRVGPILVDVRVLEQRFACVPERCAPSPGRGRSRSCCADAEVYLSGAERRRLTRVRSALPSAAHAARPSGCGFGADGVLARPEGRCVFSKVDGRGRIRCQLHAVARKLQVEQNDVQPMSCRLFPLALVDVGRGRLILTVVGPQTHRLLGAWPPGRYPCLSDRTLPPLYRSMRRDLDWLFGEGFAQALARLAKSLPSRD